VEPAASHRPHPSGPIAFDNLMSKATDNVNKTSLGISAAKRQKLSLQRKPGQSTSYQKEVVKFATRSAPPKLKVFWRVWSPKELISCR